MKAKLIVGLGVAVAPWLLTVPAAAQEDETFSATAIVTIPATVPCGPGLSHTCTVQPLASFDIGFVDSNAGVYLLADRANAAIDVVDTATNTLIALLCPAVNAGSPTTCVSGVTGFMGVVAACPSGFSSSTTACSGPNGVLTVPKPSTRRTPAVTEVWGGDGNSRVWVLNLATGNVIEGPISTQTPIHSRVGTPQPQDPTRADEGCYDPDHGVVAFANDASVGINGPAPTATPYIVFISASTHKVLGRIVMDGTVPAQGGERTAMGVGGMEQCQYDSRTKMIYLNLPGARVPDLAGPQDLVLQIDPVRMTIVNTVNITQLQTQATPPGNCVGTAGMAIGPNYQIGIACSNSGSDSIIIDDRFSHDNTALVAMLYGENGADEMWFNGPDYHYFFAASNNKPAGPILGVADALGEDGLSAPETDPNATSAAGSHSVAADPVADQVYVPINNKATGFCSTLKDGNGNFGVDLKGCIAIFTSSSSGQL